MQPIIKYTGSKKSVAKEIADLFPRTGGRFFDPFVGGGSILPYRPCDRAMAGDIIPELIEIWQLVKSNPKVVADEYRKRWGYLQKNKDFGYYKIRRHFNATRNPHDFLFLTRTCVMGCVRFNSQGNFNQGFHPNRPGINPLSLHLIAHEWSRVIKHVTFKHGDYREILQYARAGDCVFLDPPYAGTKGQYMPVTFQLDDFLKELDELNRRGVHWVFTYDGHLKTTKRMVPRDLYSVRYKLNTGQSSLKRVVSGTQEEVSDSLYTNIKRA